MANKKCSICGVEKPLDAFSPSKTGIQGRVSACRECRAARYRETYALNPDRYRQRARDNMRRYRADPEKNSQINEQRREYYHERRRPKQQAYYANLRDRHFFAWRARLWSARFGVRVTAIELASLWHRQRGRCALSGRKLTHDAHLDHVIPASSNGSHSIENLRWLDPVVNVMRGNLPDEEFVAICKQISALDDL